jgi:hypothetical protein
LNADPDADAELPGVFGAVELPQDWLGCPEPLGIPEANAPAAGAKARATHMATTVRARLIASSFSFGVQEGYERKARSGFP